MRQSGRFVGSPDIQLSNLASLYGIKTNYFDMNGHATSASNDTLMSVLISLGSPLSKIEDAQSAIRQRKQQFWREIIDPVIVGWEDQQLKINLRLPAKHLDNPISASIDQENGSRHRIIWSKEQCHIKSSSKIEGIQYFSLDLSMPSRLPIGYHKLIIELGDCLTESLIISSPRKAFIPLRNTNNWGIFVPLYALHSRNSWGAGDFSDLEDFMTWLLAKGANFVGTLPLLPSFFDDKYGPGPYMPASRLFWNEFYLNINQIPELQVCPEAVDLLNSGDFQRQISELRSRPLVDYNRQLNLKRKILEKLTDCFYKLKPERFSVFQAYVNTHSSLEEYASFRAAGEKYGLFWDNWPDSTRNTKLRNVDYSLETQHYYLYTQWLAHDQVQNLALKAREDDLLLYLDLPVGVHPYSYDVWREKSIFAFGMSGGAPPDPVFTNGQNWSFPPLHPENIRKNKYGYLIESLRHQLKYCGMLRIDHIMNFHRLFWIPEGMANKDGVYVGYNSEELYAILALESVRSNTIIVGEDLGIVPPEVRPMMEKHGIFRMFVGQYELIANKQLAKVPSNSIASLNTHDMFPFASFWQASDISERRKLKLLDPKSAKSESDKRQEIKKALVSILQQKSLTNEQGQDSQETFIALLLLLASSSAFAVLINLEDLWLENNPQNIPGTQAPENWRRKTRYSFDEFSHSPGITNILNKISLSRRGY